MSNYTFTDRVKNKRSQEARARQDALQAAANAEEEARAYALNLKYEQVKHLGPYFDALKYVFYGANTDRAFRSVFGNTAPKIEVTAPGESFSAVRRDFLCDGIRPRVSNAAMLTLIISAALPRDRTHVCALLLKRSDGEPDMFDGTAIILKNANAADPERTPNYYEVAFKKLSGNKDHVLADEAIEFVVDYVTDATKNLERESELGWFGRLLGR